MPTSTFTCQNQRQLHRRLSLATFCATMFLTAFNFSCELAVAQPRQESPFGREPSTQIAGIFRRGLIKVEGQNYAIFASKTTGSFTGDGPFYHFLPFQIRLPSSGRIYDAESKRLNFTVSLEADPVPLRAAMLNLAAVYDEPPTPRLLALADNRQFFQPFELRAYKLELRYGLPNEQGERKTLLLRKEGEPETRPISVSEFAIDHPIPDSLLDLQESLAREDQSMDLVFTPTYRIQDLDVVTVKGTIIDSAERRAGAEVFGSADTLIVNRRVRDDIAQTLSNSMRLVVEGESTDTSSLLSVVTNYFASRKPLEFSEVERMEDAVQIMTPEQIRFEIAPTTWKKITTGWKTRQEFSRSFQSTWKSLSDMAKDNESTDDFYHQLREKTKGDSELAGSVNVLFVSVKPDLKLHFNKETDEVLRTHRSDIERVHNVLKQESTLTESEVNNSFKEWTGLDETAGNSAKSLNLYRIARSEIRNSVSATVIQAKYTATRNHEAPVSVTLFHSASKDRIRGFDRLEAQLKEHIETNDIVDRFRAEQIALLEILVGRLGDVDVNMRKQTLYFTGDTSIKERNPRSYFLLKPNTMNVFRSNDPNSDWADGRLPRSHPATVFNTHQAFVAFLVCRSTKQTLGYFNVNVVYNDTTKGNDLHIEVSTLNLSQEDLRNKEFELDIIMFHKGPIWP